MVQIGRYTKLPVLHTVSLIDWATGGPHAGRLARPRTLREPQPKPKAVEVRQRAQSASAFERCRLLVNDEDDVR